MALEASCRMMLWLARRGDYLSSTDDDGLRVIRRLGEGECQCFERLAVRDIVAHRRYWALMTMVAEHVERVEIDRVDGRPVYMHLFSRKENAHIAMKLCTGLYDILPVEGTNYAIRIPKSTSFNAMTADEWSNYWPRVMDVIYEIIFPEVKVPEVQTEILKCIGVAA